MPPKKRREEQPPALDESAMERLRSFASDSVSSLVPLFESEDWECCDWDVIAERLVEQLVGLYPKAVKKKIPPPARTAKSQDALRSFYAEGRAFDLEDDLEDDPSESRGARFDEHRGLLKIWRAKEYARPKVNDALSSSAVVTDLVAALHARHAGTHGVLRPDRIEGFLAAAQPDRAHLLWIVADRTTRALKITDEHSVARQRCSVALSVWLPAIQALDVSTDWSFRCQQLPPSSSCLILSDGKIWIAGYASAPGHAPPVSGRPHPK